MASASTSPSLRLPLSEQQQEPSNSYPYLPPPGIYSVGSDHPQGTHSCSNGSTRTSRVIEIVFHGIQAIVSTYALLNIISTVQFQHMHGYLSGTAWILLFASAASTLMAAWYCAMAWHVDTTGANTQEDIEKALQARQPIRNTRGREISPGSSVSTERTDKREGIIRCCFRFLISPRPRVWILISLISLTLMASVLQGYRIRRGFNCAQYAEAFRGFCENTKAAVISTFLTSLLWFSWFAFWFLTAFCDKGNTSRSSGDRKNVESTIYGSDVTKGEDDIVDELAVGNDVLVAVTQANHSTLQQPRGCDPGKQLPEQASSTLQSSLPSYTTIQYLDISDDLVSPESGGSSSLLKELGGSVMNPTELLSAPTIGMDKSDNGLVKNSTLPVKALQNDECITSGLSPDIESNRSESDSSHSKVFSKVQSAPNLYEATSPVLPKSKRSVRFALQRGTNVETNFRKRELYSVPCSDSMRNISGTMTANQQNADISSMRDSSLLSTLHDSRPQIELARKVTEPSTPQQQQQVQHQEQHQQQQGGQGLPEAIQRAQESSRPSYPNYPNRHPPVRSNTTSTIETRRQIRASIISEEAHNDPTERPRSFSLGRMASSRKLRSWFGPSRSTGVIRGIGSSTDNNVHNLGMSHRHSSASSIVSTLSLSLEDQQRLQRFRQGQLPYPPPPSVSPVARMSVSYFPDLEQREKDRILNKMPHHSFSL